ncbi:hypothetical protein [Tautonia sociabilis]|uniref:hypothetical protein n=1 Tax=Tautonia sociabilis TaxID=2080755 RepID=UPI0018F4A915|nr:hypothetical protein [Tautonia sociabilis]
MFIKTKVASLLGALVVGGMVTLGAPQPARAQLGGFGQNFGYGPGITPTGSFGSINLNLGFGQGYNPGPACRHGCKVPCRHVPPPTCRLPYRPAPGFGGYPGFGFGGGMYYREFRTGYGFPGYGFPGHGRHGGHGRGRHCW